jgi:hypothetical protein
MSKDNSVVKMIGVEHQMSTHGKGGHNPLVPPHLRLNDDRRTCMRPYSDYYKRDSPSFPSNPQKLPFVSTHTASLGNTY